jgi:hypothetical protein
MKSPKLIAEAWAELAKDDPDMTRAGEWMGMVGDAFAGIGPRLGWAMWNPDLQSLMGGVMAAQGGDDTQAMTRMMPKVLLVADIRDAAKLDDAISRLVAEAGMEPRVTEGEGKRTIALANGMVELIRGPEWLAVSFPPEPARKAADRATGSAADSLLTNADYRKAMGRLPADACYTKYVSPAALRQLLALVNAVAPDAGISYPPDEPLAGAMGVRVDEADGRNMATVYYTADLASLANAIDAALSLQVTFLKPIIQHEMEQSRRRALSEDCADQLYGLLEAMDSYLVDHGNRYPSADRWVEQLRPYVEDAKLFKCPEDSAEGFSSYGMNAALGGLSPEEVADPEWTVLFYETAHPGANPSGGADDVADPARHFDGNNFAFVDDTVAAFAPDDEEQPVWNPAESTAEEEPASEESGEDT